MSGRSPELRLQPIGTVRSSLATTGDAPRQHDEGAPPARLVVDSSYRDACDGITVGSQLVVLTWLHLADRSVLRVRPRNDTERPRTGVFATRSPDRPNPIGLHVVTITDIDDTTLTVDALVVVDGTPVIDLKPVLGPADTR